MTVLPDVESLREVQLLKHVMGPAYVILCWFLFSQHTEVVLSPGRSTPPSRHEMVNKRNHMSAQACDFVGRRGKMVTVY